MTEVSCETQPEIKKRCAYIICRVGEDQLLEIIASPTGYLQLALSHKGELKIVTEIEEENERVLPNSDVKPFLDTDCLFLPSGPSASSISTLELLECLKTLFKRYAFVPEEWLEPIALYLMMTWVYDRFTALCYLRFLGEPGTGKTRLLEICAALAYRGFKVSGNITGPALFRSIEMLRGTIAIDEADFRDSEEWNDIIKVINCGYKAGIPVFRCEGLTHAPKPYRVYGPKIISTRQRFDDQATETRCLTFQTEEVRVPSHIPLQLPMCFFHETRKLRNELLRWRFDNFFKISPQESDLRELTPRLGEVGASLCAVAPVGEVRERLVRFLGNYDAMAKEDSDKTMVGQALAQLREKSCQTATVGDIAAVVNEFARSLGKPELKPRRVGGILRSAFRLTSKKTRNGFQVNIPAESVNV